MTLYPEPATERCENMGEKFGYVHSTESFGAVDGPGVRFVVFLSGCPMRCKYCHNPDTWDMTGGVKTGAEAIVKRALRCRSYWGDEGGVTVSGGEPLMQIDFVIDLFRRLKAEGVNTCIDTSGAPFTRKGCFFEKFKELMDLTDLLMVDIKHIDPDRHLDLTGRQNDNILDMLRYLSEIEKPVWIRHVLVPGITDDDAWLCRMRKFIDKLGNVKRVEVLPYHAFGAPKWDALGLDYELAGTKPPAKERVENAKKLLGA